jgi:hypothetical protein
MSWESISHIIFLVFFAFVFIVFIKYNVFVELAKGTWEMLVKLWDAFHGIEDREAYDANAEQRKKDEEYKKQMKKKK